MMRKSGGKSDSLGGGGERDEGDWGVSCRRAMSPLT